SGTVPGKEMAKRAPEIARQVIGVKEVHSEIKYTNADMSDSGRSNEPESHAADGAVGTENNTQGN
ncbi:MAG: BON domain-containing protein, partial [Candidatus Binataceae bacterium]